MSDTEIKWFLLRPKFPSAAVKRKRREKFVMQRMQCSLFRQCCGSASLLVTNRIRISSLMPIQIQVRIGIKMMPIHIRIRPKFFVYTCWKIPRCTMYLLVTSCKNVRFLSILPAFIWKKVKNTCAWNWRSGSGKMMRFRSDPGPDLDPDPDSQHWMQGYFAMR